MQRIQVWLKTRNYAWKYKLRICLPIFAVLIAIDWFSKFAVMKTMNLGASTSFIPGFLRLNYVINLGSAYGSNQENPALAIGLATMFTFFIMLLFIFGNDKKWLVGLSFLGGGSLANLFSRTWSPSFIAANGGLSRGGVIDFLQWDFKFLGGNNYIFNLADVFVIAGIVLIVLFLIFELIKLFHKPPKAKQPSTPTETALEEQNREEN